MAEPMHPDSNVPQFTVHDRLRKAREWAGYTRHDFAGVIDISRGTILNYETGATAADRLKPIILKAWALACEVPYEWLRTGAVSTPDGGATQARPSTIWENLRPLAAAA